MRLCLCLSLWRDVAVKNLLLFADSTIAVTMLFGSRFVLDCFKPMLVIIRSQRNDLVCRHSENYQLDYLSTI